MKKPICVQCQREMKMADMGVTVVYLYSQPPEPYQAYAADLYKCPECGAEVIVGTGERPFWEQWQEKPAPSGDNVYYVKER
jgi:DNA-directed RNA polymerase subunit RPC12/RpoP